MQSQSRSKSANRSRRAWVAHRMVAALTLGCVASIPAQAAATDERARELQEVILKNYPPRALAAGEQGPVFFSVEIDKSGQATSCAVTRGSGYPLLDAETCSLIVGHAVFATPKDAGGNKIAQQTQGVVNWVIPGRAASAPQTAANVQAGAPGKQICKRTVRIGTLAGFERTCMTREEWTRQSDEIRESWQDLQGRKGSSKTSEGGQ